MTLLRSGSSPATVEATSAGLSDAASGPAPLPADQLYRAADLSGLSFESTAELEPVMISVGQQRALQALDFGTQIERAGFNIFVVGPSGLPMQETVKRAIESMPLARAMPSDWAYVNNFTDASKPVALELPAGRGIEFRDAVRELIADLKTALRAVFEGDDYQVRRSAIESGHQGKQEKAFATLHERAAARGIGIPTGFVMAPIEKGQIVPPEEFGKWSEAKQREVQEAIEALQTELEQVLRHLPQLEKERRNEIRKLNAEMTRLTVGQSFDEIKVRSANLPEVIRHLDAARNDLIDNVPISS